jgi:DNA-binding transcriptional LysR family regulator
VAALQALDEGMAQLEAAQRAEGATLRVGLAGTAVVPLAGETMRLFAERHPGVDLKVSDAGLNAFASRGKPRAWAVGATAAMVTPSAQAEAPSARPDT